MLDSGQLQSITTTSTICPTIIELADSSATSFARLRLGRSAKRTVPGPSSTAAETARTQYAAGEPQPTARNSPALISAVTTANATRADTAPYNPRECAQDIRGLV